MAVDRNHFLKAFSAAVWGAGWREPEQKTALTLTQASRWGTSVTGVGDTPTSSESRQVLGEHELPSAAERGGKVSESGSRQEAPGERQSRTHQVPLSSSRLPGKLP